MTESTDDLDLRISELDLVLIPVPEGDGPVFQGWCVTYGVSPLGSSRRGWCSTASQYLRDATHALVVGGCYDVLLFVNVSPEPSS